MKRSSFFKSLISLFLPIYIENKQEPDGWVYRLTGMPFLYWVTAIAGGTLIANGCIFILKTLSTLN